MDGTEGVARFVCNDLPFRGALSSDNHVGTSDGLGTSGGRAATGTRGICTQRAGDTCLTEPGKTDGASSVAGAEQSPVAVVVL